MPRAPLLAITGIDRLRPRGGAKADHLFDFVNGYRTAANTARVRPGTFRRLQLPAGTHGLTAFAGKLHVFASEQIDDSNLDPLIEIHVLPHPTDREAMLERIHFAEPFLNALYVVAEFDDGQVFHYWLQQPNAWEAEHEYSANDMVTPTTPNGYVYRATRLGAPYPAWTPGAPRDVYDKVEPTTYNEYYFEVVDVQGDNPRSGTVEPKWPTNSGEQIVESAVDDQAAQNTYPTPPEPPPPNQPQSTVLERYTLS